MVGEAGVGLCLLSPRRNLHWLVVGSLDTDAWKHSRYGTKIEKVIEHKREGEHTVIVREVDFVRAVTAAGE